MSKTKVKTKPPINYVNVICGVRVIVEDVFRWTQEFEDAKGKPISEKVISEFNWSIVEFADGSKYLMEVMRNSNMCYPIGEWKKVPANPIGSHPDWEDYKADHIVGNEEEWDEEGEWNVFCADRELV
jgi:hypothetical protein